MPLRSSPSAEVPYRAVSRADGVGYRWIIAVECFQMLGTCFSEASLGNYPFGRFSSFAVLGMDRMSYAGHMLGTCSTGRKRENMCNDFRKENYNDVIAKRVQNFPLI